LNMGIRIPWESHRFHSGISNEFMINNIHHLNISRAEGTLTLREMRGRESRREKQVATQVRGRRSWRTPTLRKSTPPHQQSGLKWFSQSRNFPHFEGTKREDVITFIRHVDEIAQGACWTDKEWALTMAELVGGRAAPLARWIRTGLSVGQPRGGGPPPSRSL